MLYHVYEDHAKSNEHVFMMLNVHVQKHILSPFHEIHIPVLAFLPVLFNLYMPLW